MGIFSGLSGAFLAGATERVSANWKESREKMEAKINKKTQRLQGMHVGQKRKQLSSSLKMRLLC